MGSEILTAAEAAALTEHETVIERGIKTFYEVGTSLAAIRAQRLYRAEYGTFEEYAQQRWQMSRPRAYELMAAAEVVSAMADTDVTPPSNERQARELSRVPEPERADVWSATVERTDGKPTAAAIRETYEQRQQPDDDPNVWIEPEAAPEPPKQKRRPLPEAFASAVLDHARTAERLARLAEDDRFAKNRPQTHHQVPELLGALERITSLTTAMNLPAAEASEEARHWWVTSLNKIADALHDVATSIEQEK